MKAPEAAAVVHDSPGESLTILAAGIVATLDIVGVSIDAIGVAAILGAIPAAVKYWKGLGE